MDTVDRRSKANLAKKYIAFEEMKKSLIMINSGHIGAPTETQYWTGGFCDLVRLMMLCLLPSFLNVLPENIRERKMLSILGRKIATAIAFKIRHF